MSKKDRFNLKGNTIAGTFRVDEVVAEGGFGIVYRAFHLHFRSPVALKCLKIPGELSEEERKLFLEQFRSEAEIQFRLSAALPQIVRPLHVDAVQTDSGEFVPLMVLEWLEGQSFEEIIEKRAFAELPPLTLAEVIELIGPAAQALHQAHNFEAAGETLAVIHRDIKPDNLFVTEVAGKKVVKILDFGISKVRRAATQLAGHFSQTAGTAPFSPAYGAPEQWVPKRFGQTGPWTDVWGLALTLVEILKGDAVILGDHQAMMGTALDPKVRPTPRSEGVVVSDEVESVFLKALSLDPRFRYQSVEAFWEALQAAAQMTGESAREYDETPSGSRIALPRMSAPTPWQSPSEAPEIPDKPLGKLPPMMAPAVLERTSPEDLEILPDAASYPINPHSDLQPVPAAPTNWSHFDPDVPPSSTEPDYLSERARNNGPPSRHDVESDGQLTSDVSSFEAPVFFAPEPLFPDTKSKQEPSLKLELAVTSVFPQLPDRAARHAPAAAETKQIPDLAPPVAQNKISAPTQETTGAQRANELLKQPYSKHLPKEKQAEPPSTATPKPTPQAAPLAKEPVISAGPAQSAAAATPNAVAPGPPLPSHANRPPPPRRSVRPPPPRRNAPAPQETSSAPAAPRSASPSPGQAPPKPPSPPKHDDALEDDDDGPLKLIPTRGQRTAGS